MRILFRILIFLGLFWPLGSLAVGVSVSPSSLDVLFPDIRESYLTVTNISAEPVMVQIELDHFQENIKTEPSEVKLLPEEATKIKLRIDFNGWPTGLENTYLSVVTRALNKKSFNAASGFKIPVTVNITKSYWRWSGAAVFLIVFGGLLIIALMIQVIFSLFKLRRKKKGWLGTNFIFYHRPFWLKLWHKLKK